MEGEHRIPEEVILETVQIGVMTMFRDVLGAKRALRVQWSCRREATGETGQRGGPTARGSWKGLGVLEGQAWRRRRPGYRAEGKWGDGRACTARLRRGSMIGEH